MWLLTGDTVLYCTVGQRGMVFGMTPGEKILGVWTVQFSL